MDQDQQSRWQSTRRQVLWTVGTIVALVVAISIVLGYVREWEWTGLVKDKAYTKRTLWDWLQLLIIPAVLAGVGLWFNRQQREQELQTTRQQREQELQTAEKRAQDEALQAYLDQIGQLLLDKDPSLRQAKEDDEVRMLARARTLTVLARLDGERKGSIVQFLSDATLIQKEAGANEEHVPSQPVISLSGADLRGANLFRADLRGANLDEAYLFEPNLWRADLRGANLRGADLRGANLFETDLGDANLSEVDLSGADLSGAKGWTEEQLTAAKSLGAATMPDGQILKSDDNQTTDTSINNAITTKPDGPTFEEWLKSKGSGENGEGSSPS